ncbi:hypothetical protein LSUE1_G004088, partial [Lachnellula suecica]
LLEQIECPEINRALRFHSIGGPLEITEKEVHPLPANEAFMKVHAASISPCNIQPLRFGLDGVVARDKAVQGEDYSGAVIAVGSTVAEWEVGDEAFGLLFHVAAFTPLVALTAYAFEKSIFKCQVTGIGSGNNEEFTRKPRSNEVIDYNKQDIAPVPLSNLEASQKYDLLVNSMGGTQLLSSYIGFPPLYFASSVPILLSEYLPIFTSAHRLPPDLHHPKGAYITIVGDKTNVKTLGGPITHFAPHRGSAISKATSSGPDTHASHSRPNIPISTKSCH